MSDDTAVSFRLCDQYSSDRDGLLSAHSKFFAGREGECHASMSHIFFRLIIGEVSADGAYRSLCTLKRGCACVECVRVWSVCVCSVCVRGPCA